MRKVLGSISLLVLLLNTLLTPITYAGEYEEILETSGENVTEEVVEENGEEYDSSEFSVEEENNDEENEEEKTEEGEEGTEETEEDGTMTGDVTEEGTGDTKEIETEELTGEVEDLTGEIAETITGTQIEELTGSAEETTGGLVEDEIGTWIGTGENEEIEYNKESIIGEKTYNDVTVKVEALSGIFPEGTELKIEPIRWWNLSNLKDKLVEEQAEVKEDTTVVAFDITFIYSGEEVQPKEGEKVKVTFDYSKNEDLVEADKQENQEVKVYHIEDKDEEGNKVEKGDEVIEKIEINKEKSVEIDNGVVIDAEKFSVYVLALSNDDSIKLTLNPGNGGSILNGGNITVDDNGIGTINVVNGAVILPGATKGNSNFMGWYNENNEIKGVSGDSYTVLTSTTLYAKWEDVLDTSSEYFPEVFSQKGACIFNGQNGVIQGDECTRYSGNKYIDTEIQLYKTENHDKDYEIGFTVVSYVGSNNVNQATLMNTKLEGDRYPGVVFRRENTNNNKFDLSSKMNYNDNNRIYFNVNDVKNVKIYRITNPGTNIQEIYYSIDGINGGEKGKVNDLSSYNPTFDTSVWFGAGPSNATATVAQRHLVGTLSNMYIKLGTYMSKVTWKYKDAEGNDVSEITEVGFNGTGKLDHEPSDYQTIDKNCTFVGWEKDGNEVNITNNKITDDTTYDAYYSCSPREYTILWKDYDGEIISTGENIPYGTVISTIKPSDPERDAVAQTGYIFTGWYDEQGAKLSNEKILTGDTIYTARYDEELRTFTITWNNWNGTPFEIDENVKYGTIPSYDGTIPTRPADARTYEFSGWNPEIGTVTQDQVYTALYRTYRNYTVNFYIDENKTQFYTGGIFPQGTIIDETMVQDPIKSNYDFIGWKTVIGDKEITLPFTVTGDLDIYANFESPYEELEGWDGCYKYKTKGQNEGGNFVAEITDYDFVNCSTEDLVLPEKITRNGRDYLIVSIGDHAFSSKYLSGTLTFSQYIENLEWSAFIGNSNLKHVVFNEGLRVIGNQSFYACGLEGTINIPANVEIIDRSAFEYNPSISSVIFEGNNVQTIGALAFANTAITGVRIPATLTTLGQGAFCVDNGTNTGTVVGVMSEGSTMTAEDVVSAHNNVCLTVKNSSYTITYDAGSHSGTINGEATTGGTVAYNATIALPTTGTMNIESLKPGYIFIGWTDELGGTEPIAGEQTITEDVTYYPIFKKAPVQYRAVFSGNGATLNGNNAVEITVPCEIEAAYNTGVQDTTCPVTTPSIQRAGYEIKGYHESKDHKDECTIKGNQEIQIDGNRTYYAITKKDLTATFDRNGNTAQTKHGETETTTEVIEETCSIWNEGTECKVRTPTITTDKEIIGYTTSTTSSGENLTGHKTEITLTTTPVTYYAWTKSNPTEIVVNYVYGTGIVQGGKTNDSCTPEVRYNGEETQTGCEITLPVIVARTGYDVPKWYKGDEAVITNEQKVMVYESESPLTLTAKAEIRGTISYVVKHYFQILSGDEITNKYALNQSLTDAGLSGVVDTTLTLSGLKKTISGFEYSKGTVNNIQIPDVEEIDIDQVIEYAKTHQLTTPVEIRLFYTRNRYQYTLNDVVNVTTEGSTESNVNMYYGQTVILSGRVSNDCYERSGWQGLPNGVTNTQQTSFTMPANPVTITPVINEKTYTIVFDANAGDAQGTVSPKNVSCAKPVQLESDKVYTRNGYLFKNWNTRSDGAGMPYAKDAEITTALTKTGGETVMLYAQWSASGYIVTFDANSGAVATPSKEVTYNQPYGELPTPTREGYQFTGWYTQPIGGEQITGTNTVTVANNHTLYAQWKVKTYTITWKNDNGGIIDTTTVEYGETPTHEAPEKAADAQYTYTFKSWEPTVKPVTGEATYTATYTETTNKYTITFVDEDGTELKAGEEYEYGTVSGDIVQPDEPTKTGDAQYTYTYNGWMPTVHNVTGPQVYTATYSQTTNSYPITWKKEDGTEIKTTQVLYGVIPSYTGPELTKEGYSFDKWTPDLEPVVGTASYTATYRVNNYDVTPVKGVGVADILGGGSYPYNTVVTLTGIAKEGYHFEGGVSEKAFTYTVPSHNITPQIDAEPNTYHVHFKPNGGTGVMANQEFVYDVEQELSPNAYTRSGFTFISWTDGEGGYYTDKKRVKNLATTGSVILLAQWFEGDGPTPGPTPTPTPSGGGSSGGGGRRPIDKDTQEHASAAETGDIKEIEETQVQTGTTTQTGTLETTEKKSTIQWTEEELTAYQYAYKYGITTLAPEEAAMPDAYVIRGHMAKMVVNYALNVLNRKLPTKMPKQCKWKDGRNAWESQEIKEYAEKACALGLMGIDMDYFQPNKLVTRAQFGTIFGRLLWGKVVSKPYYAEHLARLKKRGIMTQIDKPEERIEVRKWAWLMFMRSEKYFKIKK